MNDPYAGKAAVYEASSGGGDDAFNAVTAAIMAKLSADLANGVDPSALCLYPVVKFSNSHYMHKTYGKTYKPLFDIVGWADKSGRAEGTSVTVAETAALEAPKEEAATATTSEPVGGPVQRRRRG
jgi:hypothetical protein